MSGLLIAAFSRQLTLTTRAISTTSCLYAEPLKKKKKIDPAIIKQREERKRKKLEKQIRRLEKNARQLKPVQELEVPFDLIDQKKERTRVLPQALDAQAIEQRALLVKSWALYKHRQQALDYQTVDSLMQSQNDALEELRKESESLYEQCIQTDFQLLPLEVKGPVTTPPIADYYRPDGDYIHKPKKWDK